MLAIRRLHIGDLNLAAVDAGILPVKHLDRAKGRLSTHLEDVDRRRLAVAMLEDALALCESSDFLTWWVVSDDASVLEAAAERRFGVVRDPGRGLNAAVAHAITEVSAQGAGSITVVPCDTPLAFRGDLIDLLDTGSTSDMVVVPSEDGGTNALYMRPPDLLPPSFGEGSLRKHLQLAEERAYRCTLLSLPRLALDIDTIEDVRSFLGRPQHGSSHTFAFLDELRAVIDD